MKRSKTIAAVSGGFDPLHAEHVRLFVEAKKYADKLVVIVDSDEFVSRKHRVLLPQWQRAFIIGELGMVDLVLCGSGPHVACELESLRPDVYVTGSDHNDGDFPERLILDHIGTKIVTLNCPRTVSSSEIVKGWDGL